MTGTWRVSGPETIAQEGGGLLITVRVDPYDRKVLTATLALIAAAPEMYALLARFLDDLNIIVDHVGTGVVEEIALGCQRDAHALLREMEGEKS